MSGSRTKHIRRVARKERDRIVYSAVRQMFKRPLSARLAVGLYVVLKGNWLWRYLYGQDHSGAQAAGYRRRPYKRNGEEGSRP